MLLRIATFNVRTMWGFDGWHSWPFRRRSTATMARLLDADVLGLQEAYAGPARYLVGRLPGAGAGAGSTAVGRGRNAGGGGESCRIVVRSTRLRVAATATRWFGAEPDRPGSRMPGAKAPRIATSAELVDTASGASFRVWNTHLDAHVAANRAASARQLAGWVDPDQPTIVLGDLNADPARHHDVFAALTDRGLRSALPGTDGPGTFHGYRDGTGHPWIDHVLVSRHWEVVDAEVVTGRFPACFGRLRYPSDHWPVVATLRLGPPGD